MRTKWHKGYNGTRRKMRRILKQMETANDTRVIDLWMTMCYLPGQPPRNDWSQIYRDRAYEIFIDADWNHQRRDALREVYG